MNDREALTAALKVYQNLPLTPEFATITKAAYKYLAQLPEKCEHGESDPHRLVLGAEVCPGKVYPAELVERIAVAIDSVGDEVWGYLGKQAVAVLDALNGETP